MSLLPTAAVTPDQDGVLPDPAEFATPQTAGWWARARSRAGARLGYAFADQVVYSFGNMVVAALISRHCAVREFGMYILTQRALDVVFQLCNVFLWGPFCFHLPGTPRGRQSTYRGSVLVQQAALCVLAALALWGAARWSATPARGLYYGVFAPLAATSLGITFREFTRRMYFAEMRFAEAFWTELATVVLQIAGVEWLLHRRLLDVAHTLTVLSAGAIAVSLWWVAREWRALEFSLHAVFQDGRRDFKLGRWLFGTNMVFMLSSQCNPWILSALLGGGSVGVYAVCESVVNIPRVALTSMQNTMAPSMARRLSSGGRRGLNQLVQQLDGSFLLGAAAFTLLVWTAGPWIAHLIFKSGGGSDRTILLLLGLNLLAMAATLARSYGLTALHRADLTFYANGAGLVLQAVLIVPLVRVFHVPGAAAALLLGTAGAAGLRALYYRRQIGAESPLAAPAAGVPS